MRTLTVTQISNMSQRKLKALFTDQPVEPLRKIAVAVKDLSAPQQYALVKWSRHPLCREVSMALKNSTIRDTPEDRRSLRLYGLATFDEKGWHVLTEEGHDYALRAARAIAQQLGLHTIIHTSYSGELVSHHCACGFRAHAEQYKFDPAFEAERLWLQHLRDVASGKWKHAYPVNAHKR